MATRGWIKLHKGYLTSFSCLVIILLATSWANDRGCQYQLINLHQEIGYLPWNLSALSLGPAFYWAPDGSYAAVQVGSGAARMFDLAIFDVGQRKVIATLPIDVEYRKNSPEKNRNWGPTVRNCKWESPDQLVYLNGSGELLRANITNKTVTKLKQLSGRAEGRDIRDLRASFSATSSTLYYLAQEGDQVRLMALDYAANIERELWSSASSKLSYSQPFVATTFAGYLGELPQEKSVCFFLFIDSPDETPLMVLHIVPLEEKQKDKVRYVHMNLPRGFVPFATQFHLDEHSWWFLGGYGLRFEVGDDLIELGRWTLCRYDLKTHQIERTKFDLDCDEGWVEWWQYLPKRALHAMVISFLKGEDQVETRLCLYDKTCSKLVASFDLGQDTAFGSYGAFSPSNEYLIMQGPGVREFRLYKLVAAAK